MGMMDRAKAAKNRTDEALSEREKALLSRTGFDWEAIKPELTDEKEWRELMAVVESSTVRNEAIGTVLERLEKTGSSGLALAKKVRRLVLA